MARTNRTQRLAQTEEALTVLFCLIDDAYTQRNPQTGEKMKIPASKIPAFSAGNALKEAI